MSTPSSAVLCRYKYDSLDRLIASSPRSRQQSQYFYNENRLTTELQGGIQNFLFQIEDKLLAQSRSENGAIECTVLVCDVLRSVLHTISSDASQSTSYTAYGHTAQKCGSPSLSAFNGERPDPTTGHYLLGNGYRAFNPVLMRFNSPDNLSPFGRGGMNSYAYCEGDPINFTDPTGHFLSSIRKFLVSSSGNLLSKPQLSVSVDFTKGAVDGISRYQNIKRISGGLYIADEPLAAGGKSLVINGHGREGGHLLSKNKILEPREFVSRLKRKGISVKDYNEVHLMICHSAEGGERSLAQYLRKKFGVPVIAYNGEVGTFYSPSFIAKSEAKKVPWLYRSSLKVQEAIFLKSKQMDIRNSGARYKSPITGVTQVLNYQPVRID